MPDDDTLKDVLSMLSEGQLAALKSALERSTAGKALSDSQLDAIKGQADSYRQAQKQAAEAVGVLWNAQLDLAIASGKMDEIQSALKRPIAPAFYDNCSCGGGGTSYW